MQTKRSGALCEKCLDNDHHPTVCYFAYQFYDCETDAFGYFFKSESKQREDKTQNNYKN